MMDDEHDNGGLGSFAWYKLGQWSAEADNDSRKLVARMRGHDPAARAQYNDAVHINGKLADENRYLAGENQQLREQIAALSRSVQAWAHDYEQLRVTAQGHLDEYWKVMSNRDNLEARVSNLQDELRTIRGED